MPTSVIETRALTKRFGAVCAVNALDLIVAAGEITGFLGRNGAGKSTTIKMLLGMTRPTSGDGTVLGRAIADARDNRELRRHVAYVGEDKHLYSYLTVEELIRFTRSFYDDWRPDVAARLLDEYQLPSARKVRALSKGMRTKLALLLGLARHPQLLILDEPSEGLDPVSIEELLTSLVAAAADGTTVSFSSHQIAEVERIADRVCIVDRGRLALDLSVERLRERYRRITVGFAGDVDTSSLAGPGVERLQVSGRQVIVVASGHEDAIVARAHSLDAVTVDVAPLTLREVFLETVRGDD